MPGKTHHYETSTLTNAAESANNTETVVATLTNVSVEYPGQTIKLFGRLDFTTGTGTTASALRIRRGGLGGTLVSGAQALSQAVAASKVCQADVSADDVPGDLQGGTYVLTQQGTGDTAVTNYNAARLEAYVE